MLRFDASTPTNPDIPPRPYGKIKDPEMHAYCRQVWLRWVAAEVKAGTIDAVPGYRWQSHDPRGKISG